MAGASRAKGCRGRVSWCKAWTRPAPPNSPQVHSPRGMRWRSHVQPGGCTRAQAHTPTPAPNPKHPHPRAHTSGGIVVGAPGPRPKHPHPRAHTSGGVVVGAPVRRRQVQAVHRVQHRLANRALAL
eukprot:365300-Chlamydomonas_euryale.AAC.21